MDEKPNKRRWFQFRIRTLLLVTAGIAAGAVCFNQYHEWQRRERARIQFEQTVNIFDPVEMAPVGIR